MVIFKSTNHRKLIEVVAWLVKHMVNSYLDIRMTLFQMSQIFLCHCINTIIVTNNKLSSIWFLQYRIGNRLRIETLKFFLCNVSVTRNKIFHRLSLTNGENG